MNGNQGEILTDSEKDIKGTKATHGVAELKGDISPYPSLVHRCVQMKDERGDPSASEKLK